MAHYLDSLVYLATTPAQLIALQEMKRISLEISRETPKILAALKMKMNPEARLKLEAQFKKYQGE